MVYILRYLCTRFPRDRGYGSGVIGESVLEKSFEKKEWPGFGSLYESPYLCRHFPLKNSGQDRQKFFNIL